MPGWRSDKGHYSTVDKESLKEKVEQARDVLMEISINLNDTPVNGCHGLAEKHWSGLFEEVLEYLNKRE